MKHEYSPKQFGNGAAAFAPAWIARIDGCEWLRYDRSVDSDFSVGNRYIHRSLTVAAPFQARL
jgi:hypothetical protein